MRGKGVATPVWEIEVFGEFPEIFYPHFSWNLGGISGAWLVQRSSKW
jgi:hypothetical protein